MLSSHSVVSSSRTVTSCSPWGGRWIGHWRTTWSTVCSSAPHSQAAEEVIPHLYKQERKRPIPVRRRLSRTRLFLGGSFQGGWVPVSGIKMRSLVGLSAHCAARMLLFSEKLMSYCAARTNWCLDLRYRASALDGRVSASGESGIIFLPERCSICQYRPKLSAINVKKQSRARLLLAYPVLYILKVQKTYGTF